MKTLVHQKNKFLLSLENKKVSDDADFHSLKGAYKSMVAQQKAVYKNLLKQEATLKQITMSNFCEDVKRWGCEADPLFGTYAEAVQNIDKLLAAHQDQARESLSVIGIYLENAKSLKEKIKEREILLTERDLTANELEKLKEKKDTPVSKLSNAQMKADVKRSAFDDCNIRVTGEIQGALDNKTSHFDIHVQQVVAKQKELYSSIYAQFSNLQEVRHTTGIGNTRSFTVSAAVNSIASPEYIYGIQRERLASPPTQQPVHQPPPQPAPQPLYPVLAPSQQPPPEPQNNYRLSQQVPPLQPPPHQQLPPQEPQNNYRISQQFSPSQPPPHQPPPPEPQNDYRLSQQYPPQPQADPVLSQTPEVLQPSEPTPSPQDPQPQVPQPTPHLPPSHNLPQPLHNNRLSQANLAPPKRPPPAPASKSTGSLPPPTTIKTPSHPPRASVTLPNPPVTSQGEPTPQRTLPAAPTRTLPASHPSGATATLSPPLPLQAEVHDPIANKPPQSHVSPTLPPQPVSDDTPSNPPPHDTNPFNEELDAHPLPVSPATNPVTKRPLPSRASVPPSAIPPLTPENNRAAPPPRRPPSMTAPPPRIHSEPSQSAKAPAVITPSRPPIASVAATPPTSHNEEPRRLQSPRASVDPSTTPTSDPPNHSNASNVPISTPTPPESDPAAIPNPFANRPRQMSRPPAAIPGGPPSTLAPVPGPFPAPIPTPTRSPAPAPVPALAPAAASAYVSSIAYPEPALRAQQESVNGKMASLQISPEHRIELVKMMFQMCIQGYYSAVIENHFTADLQTHFPEPKFRKFIDGMLKYGHPTVFEPIPPSKPTAFSVAITFNVTAEAKYLAKVDFFFEGEKFSGLFSQKGIETVPTPKPVTVPNPVTIPKPITFVPPANEDKKVGIWRNVLALCLQNKYDEAMKKYFSFGMIEVFPPPRLKQAMEQYISHYGAPIRVEAARATREGYFGVAMIIKETYLITLRVLVHIKVDWTNQISALYFEKFEGLYLPHLDRQPIMAITVGSKARAMKGVLRVQISCAADTLILFSAPVTIPGHQENGKLTVYSPSSVTVVPPTNCSGEVAHYTLIKPSQTPAEVVAEYYWTYKERCLVASDPGHIQIMPTLTAEEYALYMADNNECDYKDIRFQQYLDEYDLRRKSNESEILFCYRSQRHLAQTKTYDAGDGYRGLGFKGVAAGCRLPATDCGGHALMFIAIARANGIPARKLMGQGAEPRSDPGKILAYSKGITALEAMMQIHVRAEFFAQGVGWVPVETTEKEDPLQKFGSDPTKPFLTKGFSSSKFDLPAYRYVNISADIQTYHAITLHNGNATHSVTAWELQEC